MARRLTDDKPRPQAARRTQPDMPVAAAVELVLQHWRAGDAFSDLSVDKMSNTLRRFAARAQAGGASTLEKVDADLVGRFVAAPIAGGAAAELCTQHARRTAVRCLYRTLRQLHLHDGDPTLDLRLPPRGALAARPLTDDEVALARTTAGTTAYGRLRVVAWALGEAGAVSSEIPRVRLRDLDDAGQPQHVWLAGTRRHDPRVAALTDWGQRILAARAAELRTARKNPKTPLAYGGNAPAGGQQPQASVCNALRAVLHASGLAQEPDVRPSSLRHWAGRRLYDAGHPLEDVARRLGYRSLDACAEDIALSWRADVPAVPA